MKALVLSIALLLVQLARVSTTQGQKGSIEGIVLGPSEQPIAGAEVKAFWSPPPVRVNLNDVPTATTDVNGRFRIEVHAGGYRIYVTASGYVYQEFGATPGKGNPGTIVTVAPGQSMQGITLRPIRDNILSGRITSINGEPLLRMEVHVLRRIFDANGSPFLLTEGRTETNDRGEYRIPGLKSGRYYVRAASIASYIIEREIESAKRQGKPAPVLPTPGVFASTYYPGAADLSRALLVDVRENAEARNLDIVLPKQPTFKIRGRVRDGDGIELPKKLSVLMIPGMGSEARPDGSFELTGLVPGTYMLIAQGEPPPLTPELRQLLDTPGASLSQFLPPPRGVALVRMLDSDVESVELIITRDLTMSGRLSVENATTVPAGAKVELRPIDTTGRIGSAVGQVAMDADGRFLYKNLFPTEYRVAVSNLPADLYVKEARLGNIDVLTQSMALMRPAPDPLSIVLAKGGATEGTLRDTNSQPLANQQIVLIPDSARNRPDLYKTATTDANGRFAIEGIAPGDYKAFAWRTIEPFRYFDPDFVRPFEGNGTPVHVTEGAKATADLKLIP